MPNDTLGPDNLVLAGDFAPASHEDWLSLVEKTLKGKPYARAMQSSTYDDIVIDGLYTRDNARIEPQVGMRQGGWDVAVAHWSGDAEAVNRQALTDLEGGAATLVLRMASGHFAGLNAEDLAQALDGVHLGMCSVVLNGGEAFHAVANSYLTLLADGQRDGSLKPEDVHGTLGIDPIGTLAMTGRLMEPVDDAVGKAMTLTRTVIDAYPNLRTISVDAKPYHTSGGSEAFELAAMLSTGVAYLRALEVAEVPPAAANAAMGFSLAADADLYMTVAKLRAARRLWARVLDACNVKTAPMHLNAASGVRMLTACDPWVNILRGTTACMGAAIGGADSITILPHDTLLGMPSDFARRIARNIQIICQEESGFADVTDAAAGSYAFETLTAELADKAWGLFQEIEAEGGILESLRRGKMQARAMTTWEARQKNLSTRRDSITGVSEFPNIHEAPIKGMIPMAPPREDVPDAGEEITPLPVHRLAEDFEFLRGRSNAVLSETGRRPAIFLANVGPVAKHTTRATFAKNFFETGGVEALPSDGFENGADLVQKYRDSGASIAVLCGSDDGYEKHAADFTNALKAAGCRRVYLAGKAEIEGVDETIAMGDDVLGVLYGVYEALGEAS